MRFGLVLCSAAILTGCGYVGDPMPPALNVPQPVADLRAWQRGDKLILDFTAPALTTEQVGLTAISMAEARLGDDAIPLDAPAPGAAAHFELPARQWSGRTVNIAIVVGGPKGQQSAPSNVVSLRLEEALAVPARVTAEPHPEGVRVAWSVPDGRATRFRITRTPDASAEVEASEFIDRAVEPGKEYKYSVTALRPGAESLASAAVTVTPRDTFAPTVPANVSAVAGVSSIELVWERSPEADLKSYRVYRNDQLLAPDIEAPAFSDRQIQSGQRYRYAVTAVDVLGNESARSSAVEVTAP
jgi:hypothetical protein